SKPDFNGISRRGLDIAGNGRFVRNVVEKSEEEREYRLDHSEQAGTGEFTDEELMTITTDDVTSTVAPLLRGLGLEAPACLAARPTTSGARSRRAPRLTTIPTRWSIAAGLSRAIRSVAGAL